MGFFDLSCKLSGLSISWPTMEDDYRPHTCSMLLLQEINGFQIPLLPPVSGVYDSYGRIELRPTATPHARWVGRELSALWGKGLLTSELADDLARLRRGTLGGEAAV